MMQVTGHIAHESDLYQAHEVQMDELAVHKIANVDNAQSG